MFEVFCCVLIGVVVGIPIMWWFISRVMKDIGREKNE